MTPEPVSKPEMIGLCSPADKGDYRLTLYLYHLEESGEMRVPEMVNAGPGLLQYPPMTLNLYYLLTAYSTAELKSRAQDEHRIMGRAMQVLYDNSILRGSVLQGTLAESGRDLRVTLQQLTLEDIARIWNFSGLPYKLSVGYRVGPVYVDSTRTKSVRRVVEVDIGIKDKEAK